MPKGFTPIEETQATPGFTPVDQTASAAAGASTGSASPYFQIPSVGLKDKQTIVDPSKQFSTSYGQDVLSTLGREGKAFYGTVKGMPGTVYHAFADPATAEEAQKYGGQQQVTGAKRIGLGIGRLAVDPMLEAGQWYKDAFQGKIPDPYGQALSVLPEAVGSAAGTEVAGKISQVATKQLINLPKEISDFTRRAKSLNEVTQAGAGLYQGKIQPTIQTLQAVIEREGAKTIEQAIQADKDAQVIQGRGSISAAPAIAEAAKTMEQSGYIPEPKTRNLLTRLNSQTEMTLEDAKNLRSDLGRAAARGTDARTKAVLWAAYDQLGDGMASRIEELQGTREPFDHYNNEFRASFNLEGKGVTKSMLEPLADRHDSIPKLKEFSQADLTEIKDQMKQYGLKPEDIDKAQKDAQALVNAHDAIGGKYRKGLYKVVLSGGLPAAAALAVYGVSQGAGMYGMVPLALAAYLGGKVGGWPEQMEAGRILRNLKIKPEDFQVRPQVEGPKDFSYKNPDEGWSDPKSDLAGRVKQAKANKAK